MAAAEQAPASVSVVICAFASEREEALTKAVESLRRQTVPPHEVIVVIDHNPALLDWVRKHVDGATVVANEETPGLAGARNTGVRAARGEVVAFLDDDAVADPDWILQLSSAYLNGDVVGVGGAVLPLFEGPRPRWMPEEFDWVVGCSYRGLPAERSPVRNLIGCNMSFRRDALERSGGFAHRLGRVGTDCLGCEETELCIRLGRETPGAVILYDPAARVAHRVTRARATLAYFLSRCHAEGLSKAEVVRRWGSSGGLESERRYVRRTLPAGVRDGLAASLGGDGSGLARAGAIALGLTATVAGYAAGSWAGTDAR
jgi:glycosyltransferase involved in cell wall biosynthesis